MPGQGQLRRRTFGRRGIASIWMAMVGLMVIGIVGLANDVACVLLARHQLQNAADAASLAGAQNVRKSTLAARCEAIRLALANAVLGSPVALIDNEANIPQGDIVVGFYRRSTGVFEPTLQRANAVKVVARRNTANPRGPVQLLFGPVFGVNTINVECSAVAMIGGGTGAGMILLNETEKWTFRLSGNVTLDVTDITSPDGAGAIQVNSESDRALKFDGTSALLRAGEINVFAASADPPPPSVFDGDINTDMPRIPDPLADLPPPPLGTNRGTFSVSGGTHTLSPGYYPGGISMTGGTVTLQSGVYVLAGNGLNVTGGKLTANGVMFYLLGGSKCTVNLTGSGAVNITPMPLESEPYGGVAIWQSSANTNPATIRGTNQFQGIDGTLYFPKARVDLTGTSDSFGIRQLICDSAAISGAGTITVNYDGRFPAPGSRVFLVK